MALDNASDAAFAVVRASSMACAMLEITSWHRARRGRATANVDDNGHDASEPPAVDATGRVIETPRGHGARNGRSARSS